MKKILAILLTVVLVLSLTACGNNPVSDTEKTDKAEVSVKNSLEILNSVWNSYPEDEKFPVLGGSDNATMDAPDTFPIDDADILDSILGFPASSADSIDDAASLIHAMNANTFTCGAFHVKNADDISALTEAIKDNIFQRQWLCGFPDKLVIVTIGDYVVSFFGANDIVNPFITQLNTAYPSAEIVVDESIAE